MCRVIAPAYDFGLHSLTDEDSPVILRSSKVGWRSSSGPVLNSSLLGYDVAGQGVNMAWYPGRSAGPGRSGKLRHCHTRYLLPDVESKVEPWMKAGSQCLGLGLSSRAYGLPNHCGVYRE